MAGRCLIRIEGVGVESEVVVGLDVDVVDKVDVGFIHVALFCVTMRNLLSFFCWNGRNGKRTNCQEKTEENG